MWEPWRGQHYGNHLLLLGESCYAWRNNGQLCHPAPNHPVNIVEAAIEDPPGYGRFMVCMTRALSGTQNPTEVQAQMGWQSVAFTNYVPVSVGEGPAGRPSQAMWDQAYGEWNELLNTLRPRKIIVLGLTMWSNMPDTQVQIDKVVQGYTLRNGSVAMCYAIKHPARGPGWNEYARFIRHVKNL